MSKRFNFVLSGLTLLPLIQPALLTKISVATSAAAIISSSQKVNANERYNFYFDRGLRKYDKGDLNRLSKLSYKDLSTETRLSARGLFFVRLTFLSNFLSIFTPTP